MGIETLNTAARAAGFAMASSEEAAQEAKVEAKPDVEGWRSEASLLDAEPRKTKVHASPAEWLKGLFGLSGRRAPA